MMMSKVLQLGVFLVHRPHCKQHRDISGVTELRARKSELAESMPRRLRVSSVHLFVYGGSACRHNRVCGFLCFFFNGEKGGEAGRHGGRRRRQMYRSGVTTSWPQSPSLVINLLAWSWPMTPDRPPPSNSSISLHY